ncbi:MULTISPECIES: NACHT domain-containing protein [Rhizobium]|uniref:NACHT domain-containing protein n=1 Tax=Rhizobium leguminosarum bv. viciae TaxID=387 RepID=A0A8G2IQT9_RHILV|nr:NACHT domain-containing protein [Rhizobium leguminosarum]MBB4509702.1 hypothetical protein [Rhizobium leguminosarum]NEI54721.1 NACHT domain-containing protein [Rhizobium leguminosarum]NEI83993.1 NACHT domain-containing protein [Rhizobium leguminosarum]NKK11484.1 NACHT domain-containing protein [Rhizobium leguminosarum bv. viciae]NKK25481.1 NACHT domain-containing protein [Rhizobium leguminosarum bv. viciae]
MIEEGVGLVEAGGTATQAGIYFQNSVAALALAEMLDLDQPIPRERIVEVRVEAPEMVDDIVVRFADGHREYQSVKLSIQIGNTAWPRLWTHFDKQRLSSVFTSYDSLALVVGERSELAATISELTGRAESSIDVAELLSRSTKQQRQVFDAVTTALGDASSAFEVLRILTVRHLIEDEIEGHVARKRLAGSLTPPPSLLRILRDLVGGRARRRGLFQPGPLRRQLRSQHGIVLREPPEWGLESYRTAVSQLCRIDIPGIGLSGYAKDLFVWPRARNHDRSRGVGFEDEHVAAGERGDEGVLDLKLFPGHQFERVVVVAGPGFGKSALLTAIAAEHATGPLVPVQVPLASLASADCTIIEFLCNRISREMELTADWQVLAEQGLLLLLLDGLDEVPSALRPRLMQRISTFSARFPQAPWMLTVRDAVVVTGLPEALVIELLPLNDDDIARFADALRPYTGSDEGWKIARRLDLYPDLARLARIPLFLSMLLATTDLDAARTINRSDLIETYLKTLFSPEEHKVVESAVDLSIRLRNIAEKLAFERLEKQEIGATHREVRAVVDDLARSADDAERLFEQIKANGILKPQSSIRLQFPYPIVQEYLAARYLVEHQPETIGQRIDDAVQRPWAQVIQFALELHAAPDPVVEAMLRREDDAFATGLRLVGHCIANGAAVGADLRDEVGRRLVQYWRGAATKSRERVGRLLLDGFSNPPSRELLEALHYPWLMEHGAGDIVSKLNDVRVTSEVLSSLIKRSKHHFLIYHGLKAALSAAGDDAVRIVVRAMQSAAPDADEMTRLSSLFLNFRRGSVSRPLALEIAHDLQFPTQVRMRAYEMAGKPLDEAGEHLVVAAFHDEDWDRNYEARDLVGLHNDPALFFQRLIYDTGIPLNRRIDIVSQITEILPDPVERKVFAAKHAREASLDPEIRVGLRLTEAANGDRQVFVELMNDLDVIPIERASTAISLFGNYSDRELAERAADKIETLPLTVAQAISIAQSALIGMLHVFEMSVGFGGPVHPAPRHPGYERWRDLVEKWVDRNDLRPIDRLSLLALSSELGSERSSFLLSQLISAIDDFDTADWLDDQEEGHVVSNALREVRRRTPLLEPRLVEKVLASRRSNVVSQGLRALEALGTQDALRRLIVLHGEKERLYIRDNIANTIELVAGRLGVSVRKVDDVYTLS